MNGEDVPLQIVDAQRIGDAAVRGDGRVEKSRAILGHINAADCRSAS